jgi:hypothetical protein
MPGNLAADLAGNGNSLSNPGITSSYAPGLSGYFSPHFNVDFPGQLANFTGSLANI